MVWQRMTREGAVATALLLVFGIALTPPVVFWVNTDALLFGWPTMFLWAVGWMAFGVAVLAWAAWVDAFALSDDQVPPELVDEAVTADAPDEPTEPDSATGASEGGETA